MPRTWTSLFHSQVAESPDLQAFIQNLEISAREISYTILRLVAQEVVKYLRDYTSKKNPPRYRRKMGILPGDEDEIRVKLFKYQQRQQDPDRPAHPGGWSDISHELEQGYYARVDKDDVDWQLVIGNRSDHAVYVEAKEGYFVVSGIMDPGGPVDKAIRKAFRLMAPTWKIQNMPGRIIKTGNDAGVQQSLFAFPQNDTGDSE